MWTIRVAGVSKHHHNHHYHKKLHRQVRRLSEWGGEDCSVGWRQGQGGQKVVSGMVMVMTEMTVMMMTMMKIMEMMVIIIGVGLSSLLTTVFLRNAMGQASSRAVQSDKKCHRWRYCYCYWSQNNPIGMDVINVIVFNQMGIIVIVIDQMGILWTRRWTLLLWLLCRLQVENLYQRSNPKLSI